LKIPLFCTLSLEKKIVRAFCREKKYKKKEMLFKFSRLGQRSRTKRNLKKCNLETKKKFEIKI
jgi:hypothetical protein